MAKIDLSAYQRQFLEALVSRLDDLQLFRPGDSVLCLGARQGTECEAFIRLGCFALGVDLNPGEGNRYVVHGDFHNLQFADQSVKIVYTNALDHSFDLARVLKEVRRVLVADGIFIAEIVRGSKDPGGRDPGDYESVWWDSSDSVVARIREAGFQQTTRRAFTYPWGGDQIVFKAI